jgi:hypothetical protein
MRRHGQPVAELGAEQRKRFSAEPGSLIERRRWRRQRWLGMISSKALSLPLVGRV